MHIDKEPNIIKIKHQESMEIKSAAAKSKIKLFMQLSKATASGITFQNPDPFSPRRDVKSHHQYRGFSGPIIPEVFEEARRNKPDKFDDSASGREPTSPKISCMGQIKQKKKKISKIKPVKASKKVGFFSPQTEGLNYKPSGLDSITPHPVSKKLHFFSPQSHGSKYKPSAFNSDRTHEALSEPADHAIAHDPGSEEKVKKGCQSFRGKIGEGKSDVAAESNKMAEGPPSLGQLKKYASGRERLSSFDWSTAQIASEESDDDRKFSSGGERRDSDEEVIIPFSAPILMGEIKPVVEMEPRREINLWKRRTMARPPPLHVN